MSDKIRVAINNKVEKDLLKKTMKYRKDMIDNIFKEVKQKLELLRRND